MTFLQILVLGIIQGAAELLPISSSAHVIVAEKLMGLDPASPEMTFLLVMLHTGTMFAIILYFWPTWRRRYFSSSADFRDVAGKVALATALTGVVAVALQKTIEKFFLKGGDIEMLFAKLPLIGAALVAVGFLIIYSGTRSAGDRPGKGVAWSAAGWVGAIQGFCLPFRGFSRSGATISTGLLSGIDKMRMEEFSFALAVVLTPLAIGRELLRLLKAHAAAAPAFSLGQLLGPGLLGMICSFGAGLLALRLLSRVLVSGRWKLFGYYCLLAAIAVFVLAGTKK